MNELACYNCIQVGLKGLDDYGSDVNTDDLAGDSDLDTSTCK